MKPTTIMLAFALMALSSISPLSVCIASNNATSTVGCCCKVEAPDSASCCAGEQESAPESTACKCHYEVPVAPANTSDPAAAPARTDFSKFSFDVSAGTFAALPDTESPRTFIDFHTASPPGPLPALYILDCSFLL